MLMERLTHASTLSASLEAPDAGIPVFPSTENGVPARGVEWLEAAKAVGVIVGTEVLLAAGLVVGLRVLGR